MKNTKENVAIFFLLLSCKEQTFGFFDRNIVKISIVGKPRNDIVNRESIDQKIGEKSKKLLKFR